VLRRPGALKAFVELERHIDERLSTPVRGFADRYGWLGQPHALVDRQGGSLHGESVLRLWLPEIRMMAELWQARKMVEELEHGDARRLGRRYVAEYLQRDGDAFLFRTGSIAGRFPVEYVRERRSPASALRTAIEMAVEKKLAGHIRLHVWGGKTVRYGPDSLLAALYFQLLQDLLDLGAQRRVCPGCGEEFRPRTGQQRYHDSACQRRHAQREVRRRKREAGAGRARVRKAGEG
jgi:hypothetical protein